MLEIDKLYTQDPSMGIGRLTAQLNALPDADFRPVNVKRVRRLARLMGLVSLAPGPHTSKPTKGHKTWPYLLRDLKISKPNHVWSTDITYLPVEKGHFYLTAIIDWYSRAVMSWRISNTMDTHFCLEALEEAVRVYGKPQIVNTDQGGQYTSDEWIKALERHQIQISMDGKGRAIDNVIVERLWRSYKYEYLYLNVATTGSALRAGTGQWMMRYNTERIHSALGMPPLVFYQEQLGE